MASSSTFLLFAYLLIVCVVCIYGLHRYWMVWTFLRRQRELSQQRPTQFDRLPPVTIQLPMFNERHVAQRVIEAACNADYPRELLQIQVLDDSTDESALIAQRCCQRVAALGHNVQYLHRSNREGYKAGALANATPSATGDFIAVFDADFVPPPSFIRDAIHHFTDESIGMVQARWTHLNRDQSLLTQIQAMYLDGHFVVEQTARAAAGRWFNFNGTAGIWRRCAIESAGGWQHDTLTEDTDLSYRAQLDGWRFKYLPDVCCPAEVPPTMSAFLSQQHRWNKGLIQTAIKMLPRIWKSDAPLRNKIEAWFHLTAPVMHVFILMLVLLVTPVLFIELPIDDVHPLAKAAISAVFLILGAFAAGTFYMASQRAVGLGFWRTLWRLPVLMALGVGISIVNTRAVLEAALRKRSPFIRTPKFNGERRSENDPAASRRKRLITPGLIEFALGLVLMMCAVASMIEKQALMATPFLVLFACGYLAVGWPQLRDAFQQSRRQVPNQKIELTHGIAR